MIKLKKKINLVDRHWRFLDQAVNSAYAFINRCKEDIEEILTPGSNLYESMVNVLLSDSASEQYFESQTKNGASKVFQTVTIEDRNDPRFDEPKIEEIDKLAKMGINKFVPEI